MTDYRFQFDKKVPAGRVVFRMINAGRFPHRLTMIPMQEDLPHIREQLGGGERRLVKPFAGIYERRPGDSGTFAVDLSPGQRYAIFCSMRDEDDKPHWMKGMATEFRTPGPRRATGITTTSSAS